MSAQARLCATFVDEWARCGVRHALVAPGSRSTPLVLALAADGRIELAVRLDERSAAFAALGAGLASGRPALLVTTSGTAAAEVHAAVVEAHQAAVPLIVCTADRPPELQGIGAPQTIEQAGLYSKAVRFELDLAPADGLTEESWRSLAARAYCEATAPTGGPGPVHVNFAFREPFEDDPGPLPAGRPGGAPWHKVVAPEEALEPWPELELLAERARRPLLVLGGGAGDAAFLVETARRAGWPVLADPRSGGRRSPGAVVAAADALLRVEEFASSHRPDLVVRLGSPWASKVLAGWLGEAARDGAGEVVCDPSRPWSDPGREASLLVRGAPKRALRALVAGARPEEGWAASWQEAERVAQEVLERQLGSAEGAGELSEPLVARRLAAALGGGTLVVSSSMPVRDLEWFSAPAPDYPSVLSNRGANGIDGVASTTVGAALGGAPGPVVGLLGDLAFLHDLTALLRPARAERSERGCGLVVIDNEGGGIFSYLPQARSVPRDRFERLFATPQGADVAELARAAGCQVSEVDKSSGLDGAISSFLAALAGHDEGAVGPVLVCRTERARGVPAHEELGRAVAAALRAARLA